MFEFKTQDHTRIYVLHASMVSNWVNSRVRARNRPIHITWQKNPPSGPLSPPVFLLVFFSSLSPLTRPSQKYTEKKLTLSRPWTTAPVTVRAETRIYSDHYIGHAMDRTAATRTPGREYAA